MENTKIPVRPEVCTDEMLNYLDDLRESGVTNMFAAGPYLDDNFPELYDSSTNARKVHISSPNARKVLAYWMDTFGKGDR